MGTFEKIIKKIGNWGTVIGAVFLSGIAVLITVTVLGRYLRIALPGTFDLVETLVVVGIAFALVYGQLEDQHLRAEIAITRLRGRLKAAIESFLSILGIFYWVVLLFAAAEVMLEKWKYGESTQILNVPVVPFRGVWVFALILMVILLCFKLIRHIRGLAKGDSR